MSAKKKKVKKEVIPREMPLIVSQRNKAELLLTINKRINDIDERDHKLRIQQRTFEIEQEDHKRTHDRMMIHRDAMLRTQNAIETITAIKFPDAGLIMGQTRPVFHTCCDTPQESMHVNEELSTLRHIYSLLNTNII